MRSRRLMAVAAGLILGMMGAVGMAAADQPLVWLHVEVNDHGSRAGNVRVTLPLSLVEVAIDSADTDHMFKELKRNKGIDLAKLWKQLKTADTDEFVTVDSDDAKVKVFKEDETFRVSLHEQDGDEGQMEIRIPFKVMDYLFDKHPEGFRLSDLVSGLKGDLPLTLVEGNDKKGGNIKIWLDEK